MAADSSQFKATQFADVVFEGSKQVVRGVRAAPYPGLICVMVQIARPDSAERDRFFVLPCRTLAKIFADGHRDFLAKHNGVRPRQPTSLHTALKPAVLGKWENRWDVLKKRVKPACRLLQPPSGATGGRA
jgi:hypothetical protein